MSIFTRLWNAVAGIADAAQSVAASLRDLSATIREANANVRENLRLDGPAAAGAALPEQQQTATTPPLPAEPVPLPVTAPPVTEEAKKGRGKNAA